MRGSRVAASGIATVVFVLASAQVVEILCTDATKHSIKKQALLVAGVAEPAHTQWERRILVSADEKCFLSDIEMYELQNFAISVGTVLVFTTIYSIILLFLCPHENDFAGLYGEKDNEKLFNRFYFTITTLSTTGFGDVFPKSNRAKWATIVLQILTTVGILTILISMIKNLRVNAVAQK